MKKLFGVLLAISITISSLSFTAFAAKPNDPVYVPDAIPYTSYPYNASRAVQYAHQFYESYNTYF